MSGCGDAKGATVERVRAEQVGHLHHAKREHAFILPTRTWNINFCLDSDYRPARMLYVDRALISGLQKRGKKRDLSLLLVHNNAALAKVHDDDDDD